MCTVSGGGCSAEPFPGFSDSFHRKESCNLAKLTVNQKNYHVT